jgi:hypothetical protein
VGWLQRLLGREALPAAQPTEAPASAEAGWPQLAPIGGTFAPPELTLRPARFEAELTTRQKPGLIGSMLHDVAIDGPAGYVAAAAQPARSAPAAEGVVRFPSPPPQLSRLGALADEAPTLPETAPQLLPSFPEPPPSGPSPVTAGEVPVGVMRLPVHAAAALSGVPGTPPTAASAGSQSAAVLSSADRIAGSPSAGRPSAETASAWPPSAGGAALPAPSVGLPGMPRPAQLSGAHPSASGEETVERRSGAPQVPASEEAAERRDVGLASPPLTLSPGSPTELVATEPPPTPPTQLVPPPLAAPPAIGRLQAHGGTAPGSEPPLTARRLQRYRLGEPQTLEREAPVPPSPALSSMNLPPASPPAAGAPPSDGAPTNRSPGGPPVAARLPTPPSQASPPSPPSQPPHSVRSPASPGLGAAPMSRALPSLPLQARASSLPQAAERAAAARPVLPASPAAPGDRIGSVSELAPLTLVGPRPTETAGPLLGESPPTLSVPFDAGLPPEGPAPATLPSEPARVEVSAVLSDSAPNPSVGRRAILAQRDVIGPASSPASVWTGATTSPDRRLERGGETPAGGMGRQPAGHGDVAPLQRASLGGTAQPLLTAPDGTVILFPGPDGRPPGAADRPGETGAPAAQRLTLQRQDAPAPAAAPDSSGGTPAPAAFPSGSSAPAPGAGAADAELDELGRRLYDRIREHLAAELAMDRERAGLLNDLGQR